MSSARLNFLGTATQCLGPVSPEATLRIIITSSYGGRNGLSQAVASGGVDVCQREKAGKDVPGGESM